MKVISTNIGPKKTVQWRGKAVQTGIYKKPTQGPIVLGQEDVVDDHVIDRKYHGGPYKACYLFGADYYDYWKAKYPDLDWNWGMFGENLTVAGLQEDQLQIGAVYQLGATVVQISEPRQPCFKLGIRFGTQAILGQFLAHGHPGTYVKVLTGGPVHAGDQMQLIKEGPNAFTVANFYSLVGQKTKDKNLIKLALSNTALRPAKAAEFKKFL